MVKIAPSILSADFSKIGKEIKAVESAGADWIHIDVMDGRFVPNLTVGPLVVEAARRQTSLPLDVHLMMVEPDRLIPDFIEKGADWVTVHVEACPHLHRTIRFIKDKGKKAGVSLNPATPVSAIEDILDEVDLVLMMSVNPGFGGQTFIENVYSKLRKVRQMIDASRPAILLEVDGGVNIKNIRALAEAGVDVFVAGTAVFKHPNNPDRPDYSEAIRALRKEAGR
ncbi:MAG: ribulose-phosphate 3-epimerase [Nitrospiria bacterium]